MEDKLDEVVETKKGDEEEVKEHEVAEDVKEVKEEETEESGYEDSVSEGVETPTEGTDTGALDTGYSGGEAEEEREGRTPVMRTSDTLESLEVVEEEVHEDHEVLEEVDETLADDISLMFLDGRYIFQSRDNI